MRFEIKRVAVAALALTAAAVVGCGGSDSTSGDAGDPGDTVQAFFDATKAKDAGAACATLAKESMNLAAAGAGSCEEVLQKAMDSERSDVPDSIEIGDVTTDGDTATVPVTDSDGESTEFRLINEGGAWKIDLASALSGPTEAGTTG